MYEPYNEKLVVVDAVNGITRVYFTPPAFTTPVNWRNCAAVVEMMLETEVRKVLYTRLLSTYVLLLSVLKIATAVGSAPAVALLGPIKVLNTRAGVKILLAVYSVDVVDEKLILELDPVLVDTRSE